MRNTPEAARTTASIAMPAMSAPVKAMTAGFGTGGNVVGVVVTTIGFVTVEEHPEGALHGPVVMVAVLVTLPVALAASLALNVTVAVWPAASVTTNVQVVLPGAGAVTVQVSVDESVTAQEGVPWTVRVDGSGSLIVADPDPSPTFLMVTVYGIVDPGATGLPLPGTSVFVMVNNGLVTRKHSLSLCSATGL